MILVTGATGTNGAEILKRLATRNIPVRAMIRDATKKSAIHEPNVEAVLGDFDTPETLQAALDGVERAFLLTNSTDRAEAQQLAFVQAAKESGVRHIVKLSQLHADKDSSVRFLRYHAAVEDAIRASGMAYTFLRPNLFMQALLGFRDSIQKQNAIYVAAGDAPVSLVDVRDIADAAVAALTEAGHENKIYDLTGPEALNFAEVAARLSHTLGRTITFVPVPPQAMRDAVVGMGMPEWQADGMIEDFAHYGRGEAATVATGVSEATGQAPRSFDDFLRDYIRALS